MNRDAKRRARCILTFMLVAYYYGTVFETPVAARAPWCDQYCNQTVSCSDACTDPNGPPYYNTTCGEYDPGNCGGGGGNCPDWEYSYQAIGAWGEDNYEWVYHPEGGGYYSYDLVSCSHTVTYHVTKTDACGQQATQHYCTYGDPTVVNNPGGPGYCCWAYQCGGTYDQCDI